MDTTTDLAELITKDHRELDRLFDGLRVATGDRTSLRNRLVKELSQHAAAEEQLVYPAMRTAEGKEATDEARHEHKRIKVLAAELDRCDPADDRFVPLVEELASEVRHHAAEEEREHLPALRAALGDDKMRQLGRAFTAAKKVSPTRPHPNAPDTQPGVSVVGGVASVVDHVRDALSKDR